jgi:chemotaxis protein histidine kinase CheA
VGAAVQLIARAEAALAAGRPSLESTWPTPPPDLVGVPVQGPLRPTYVSEMRDRCARIDAILAARVPAEESLALALREIHGMKGAATAAKDEAMAWFCHGMEAHLRAGRGDLDAAARVLRDLASLRGVLGELAIDPARALSRLSGEAARAAPSSNKHSIARRASTRPPPAEEDDGGDGTVRIPAAALDRLLERAGNLGRLGGQIAAGVDQARASSRRLRELPTLLGEALRLIGPPRPWGAPAAALTRVQRAASAANAIADELEFGAAGVRERAEDLGADAASMSGDLSALRRTRAGWLLDRVRRGVETQARIAGVSVSVVVEGAEISVDRRVLEQLVDPLLQVAVNAVAHGIEPAEDRASAGKPETGMLKLSAAEGEGRLRVQVADDGAGVDVARVRARAIESGVVPPDVAERAGEDALLDLLFLPGFTTRAEADLLAGRGMGLDLAASALRRLGGRLRLSSRRGRGVTATLDVPLDGGPSTVLWVRAGGRRYAIPARSIRRVAARADSAPAPPLAELLGMSPGDRRGFVVELTASDVVIAVEVDEVGALEEVTLRPLSPLLRGAGPYRAAVVQSDGRVELVLEASTLAELV